LHNYREVKQEECLSFPVATLFVSIRRRNGSHSCVGGKTARSSVAAVVITQDSHITSTAVSGSHTDHGLMIYVM